MTTPVGAGILADRDFIAGKSAASTSRDSFHEEESALALYLVVLCTTDLMADEQNASATSQQFFERLDTNKDGKITFAEAPAEGKMLVEFLLSRAGKKKDDHLSRQDFVRLASVPGSPSEHRHVDDKAVAAALANGEIQTAPENCAACAMGLTAEFVLKRLDVDEDTQRPGSFQELTGTLADAAPNSKAQLLCLLLPYRGLVTSNGRRSCLRSNRPASHSVNRLAGGVGGYAEFFEAIGDPKHEEHDRLLEWAGLE